MGGQSVINTEIKHTICQVASRENERREKWINWNEGVNCWESANENLFNKLRWKASTNLCEYECNGNWKRQRTHSGRQSRSISKGCSNFYWILSEHLLFSCGRLSNGKYHGVEMIIVRLAVNDLQFSDDGRTQPLIIYRVESEKLKLRRHFRAARVAIKYLLTSPCIPRHLQ